MKENPSTLSFSRPPDCRLELKPWGDLLRVENPVPDKVGVILMPSNAKFTNTVIVQVIAAGPDCKLVKSGDRVVVKNPEGVMKVDLGEDGCAFFCQESKIFAIAQEEK